MTKSSHGNTFYFLRYAHVRYVKCLLINISKQWNMLKISLIFVKFTNSTCRYNPRILKIKNAKF